MLAQHRNLVCSLLAPACDQAVWPYDNLNMSQEQQLVMVSLMSLTLKLVGSGLASRLEYAEMSEVDSRLRLY